MIRGCRRDLVADQAVHGRDVDNAAVGSRKHGLLRNSAGHFERAQKVDVQLIFKLRVGNIFRRSYRAGAGIVDENINAAEIGKDLVHDCVDHFGLRNVAGIAGCRNTELLRDCRCVLFHEILAARKKSDRRAFRCQCLRHLNAKACGSAGHDSDLSGEIKITFCHRKNPPSVDAIIISEAASICKLKSPPDLTNTATDNYNDIEYRACLLRRGVP